MSSDDEIVVSSGNLSVGWAQALLRTLDAPGGASACPLFVAVTEFDEIGEPREDAEIRTLLDKAIESINRCGRITVPRVSATAQTIFPHMCWSPRRPRPADELFAHYRDRVLPRLRKRCQLNARGTYFSRMIDATGWRPGDKEPRRVNQLADLLQWWKRDNGHTRRSALQVSLYDPAKDHNGSSRAGFPCLQQVSFGYGPKGLTVAAFYPTEYIFDRGYGNYLGLCRLGAFMAHEMGLPIHRARIYVDRPTLGNVNKGDLASLASSLGLLVGVPEPSRQAAVALTRVAP